MDQPASAAPNPNAAMQALMSVSTLRSVPRELPPLAPASGGPAWSLRWTDVGVATAACLVASTQLLFQPDLYQLWPAGDIAVAWLRQLRDLLLVAGAILGALAATSRVRPLPSALRITLFGTALFAGALAGETAAYWLAWDSLPGDDFGAVLVSAALRVPVGLAIAVFVVLQRRTTMMESRSHDSQVRGLRFERQAMELHLQVLKSQIEPHFLFNTLATIRRLQDADPARGRETLASFIRYLRAAVPELRGHETTLGREVDLVGAYLEVLRSRMEDGLRVRIDVPDALRHHPLPPLSLATLVENAVKHGVSKIPEGGEVSVTAHVTDECLVLQVSDTGPGFIAAEGGGTGLANLRARLRALYGERAALSLAPNSPHGLVATLRLPVAGTARPLR